jgi:hypothetical protein
MPSEEISPAAGTGPAADATPPHAGGGPDTVPSSGLLSRRSTGFGFDDDVGSTEPDTLVGVELGDVRIERFVAQGGMGRVYEARQRHPDRAVAVKVMRPGSRSPAALQRFRREAEVLGRLRHPGIAQIFTAGCHRQAGEETPYFVMEFVPGAETLGNYCDRQQLPARRRLELLLAACEALAHGHAQGVVHRDLKPGNILVDVEGRPKVIDFGIARLIDDAQPDAGACTETGQFVGTRQYMSPEQCGGGRIDARTDVYALGVILHEVLTGRLPYDVAGKSLTETARIVQQEPPARLVIPDRVLGGGADAIAARCLAKRPADRYDSAAELAADLRHLLAGQPLAARPRGIVDACLAWAWRRRTAVGAGGAAVLSAIVVAAILSRPAARPDAAGPPAPALFDLRGPEASFDVVSSGRTTPLQWICLAFNEPVDRLGMANFRLTRDGIPVPMTAATLTGASRNWRIDGLERLTADEGTYVLELVPGDAPPRDVAGNPLAEPQRVTWRMPACRHFAFNLLDDAWQKHVVSLDGLERHTERFAGAATFIRPTVAGKEGVVVLRFDVPFPIHDATLSAGLAVWTTGDPFPYDPGAKAALDVSRDGQTWTTVASLEANRGGFAPGPHDIASIVSGGSQVWVRARLVGTREWPGDGIIFAQFMRTTPNPEGAEFDLSLTGPHPPVIPGAAAAFPPPR